MPGENYQLGDCGGLDLNVLSNPTGCKDLISFLPSETIDYIGGGAACDPLRLEVKISAAEGNIISVNDDGLFASAADVLPSDAVGLLANDGNGVLSWQPGYAAPLLNQFYIPFTGADGKLTDTVATGESGALIWADGITSITGAGFAFIGVKNSTSYTGIARLTTTVTGSTAKATLEFVKANSVPYYQIGLDNTSFIIRDAVNSVTRVSISQSGNLGIGTTSPTHFVTIPSQAVTASSGIAYYNTADQTTNYERVLFTWASNIFLMRTYAGGTGTQRSININGATFFGGTPNVNFATTGIRFRNLYADISGATYGIDAANVDASGSVTQHTFINNVAQIGTAGYTSFKIVTYESTVGSGAKLLFDVGKSSATNGGGTYTSLFSISNTGSVGIGVTPTVKLDVSGNIRQVSDSNFIIRPATSANFFVGTTFQRASDGTEIGGFKMNESTGELRFGGLYANYFPTFYSNNSERARIDTSGNLLLGTITATGKLTIVGAGNTGSTVTIDAINSAGLQVFRLRDDSTLLLGSGATNAQFIINSTNASAGVFSPAYSSGSANIINYKNFSGVSRMTFDMSSGTGLLGINTTTPQEALHVVGSSRIESGSQSYSTSLISTNRLQVKQNTTGGGYFLFELAPFTDIATGNFFVVQRHPTTPTQRFFFGAEGADLNTIVYEYGDLTFKAGGYPGTEMARLTSAGRLGLGTSAPTHPFTIGSTNMVTNGGIALYSTADQTTNYQRLNIKNNGVNGWEFRTEKGGTAASSYVDFLIDGQRGLLVQSSGVVFGGNILSNSDNLFDIGRFSAQPYRPRSLYLGLSAQIGLPANTLIGARMHLGAGTTTLPQILLEDGVAPTSPVDGSLWRVGDKVYVRLGGVTKEIAFV